MENVNQNNLDSENIEKYIKDVQAIPDLTVEEEKELFEKIAKKEDKEAIEKITKANLKLVVSIAKKYVGRNPNITLLNLIQEGNAGLFKAIKKFDLEKVKSKNYTFKQYATWWIRQSITRKISHDSGTDTRWFGGL